MPFLVPVVSRFAYSFLSNHFPQLVHQSSVDPLNFFSGHTHTEPHSAIISYFIALFFYLSLSSLSPSFCQVVHLSFHSSQCITLPVNCFSSTLFHSSTRNSCCLRSLFFCQIYKIRIKICWSHRWPTFALFVFASLFSDSSVIIFCKQSQTKRDYSIFRRGKWFF